MVPVAGAWPWPVVPRLSVLVSLLVLRCFPVAAPPLPVLPVVRPRWPVAPVRLVPLVQLAWQLLAVPRQRLAAQAQQAVELIPPVVVVAQAVPAARVQALVADPVPRVVLPTQPPVRSAGILTARTVLLVDLQEKPWEPKALGRLLPRAPVQRPVLVAGKPLADRLHPPGRRPVPQMVLLGLIPRPPGTSSPTGAPEAATPGAGSQNTSPKTTQAKNAAAQSMTQAVADGAKDADGKDVIGE